MFSVGDKIIYNESGVCTVETIAPLDLSDGRLYYHLQPLVGSGKYFSPVDSGAFMRPVISQEEAEALIAAIPDIEPAVCNDTRFNHVDAFYKELFRKHTPEALVSIIKGLRIRAMGKKAKSSRAEATMKRAKEALYGELSVALSIAYPETEEYVKKQVGEV